MLYRNLLLACTFVSVASAAKRPIAFKDFNTWRTISGQALSPDGHFLAYGLFPQEGDGEVVIRNLGTGKEWREPAGELPPPPAAEANAEGPPGPRVIQLNFSFDSKTLVFLAFPKRADLDRFKKDKTQTPKGDLVIEDLATAQPVRIAGAKNFQIPERASGFVAYQKDDAPPPTPATPSTAADNRPDQTASGRRRGGAAGNAPVRDFGSDMILRKLSDGSERRFPDTFEYSVSKDGKTLVYSVTSPKFESDGIFVTSTVGDTPRALLTGRGKYERLTWNDKQDTLAFATSRDSADPAKPTFAIYLWNTAAPKAQNIVSPATPGFRKSYVVSERAQLNFSKDGTRLFFGAAPPPPPLRTGTPADDQASFDLWSYKDDHIQPIQKARATADRNRSYRAVYILAEHKLLQLADDEMTDLIPADTGHYALGADDRQYRTMSEYGEHYTDSYLVDTETGKRTILSKKHLGTVLWSPDGRFALAFDGKDWSSIAVPTGKATNLTSRLPVKFWTEDNDIPGAPRPYGLAGWTKDGKHILLYDHYDIWEIANDGSSAVNVTGGFGRKNQLELRYVKLDAEEKFVDSAKPQLLRAENTATHETGFFTDRLNSDDLPQKLLMAAEDYSFPTKAKGADTLLLSGQTFTQFPDLLITDLSFSNLKKVSNANPQQSELLWGTAEMVRFQNMDGVPLEGVLYKPEDFDPQKKYPLLIYIYEKLSQNYNHFVDPKPMDSINIPWYVSNGYLVFTPDIVYTTGYPGQSALKCVMGGLNAVVARGFVDEKNIGIQGHSWGGYQVAYMITQTHRFKAVEAGAPVSDMISAYDGIRWGTGLPRQFQYEISQSRIGGSIWEYPLRFIENSPIFQADRVHTPILIVHNDQDDAVPWYQGIEYYLALRRLGKEVYMFNYNGEPHHLRRRANQKDYAMRLAQYFDYELKGGPKPAWMEKGIPYLHTPEAAATSTDR